MTLSPHHLWPGARVIRPRHTALLDVLKRRHEEVQQDTMAVFALAMQGEGQVPGAGAAPAGAAAAAAAAAVAAAPYLPVHDDPSMPPALRRRTVAEFKANPPCAFFTPPHRCIVCLTSTHAPSLVCRS